MHPAFSVIFLTTLIGAGQGLFLALFTGQFYSLANLIPAQDSISFYALGSLIVLVLLGLGLFASFFHLGRPERAWRAVARWRTSWLSREVIVLPAFMFLVFVYGISHYFGWNETIFVIGQNIEIDPTLIIGILASIMAFVLFVCTAMIYASLRFLQEWHTPLTLANYTFLGIASGFTLAAAFSAWIGADLVGFYGLWAVKYVFLLLVFVLPVLLLGAAYLLESSQLPTIAFALPRAGAVTLEIFDIQGRKVRSLLNDQRFEAGRHEQPWDGRDAGGRGVSSGVYFYRFAAGAEERVGKLTLLK